MNKPSSIITRLLCPDPVLFWAYALPILYWIYLTLTANFVLIFDSENYYSMAQGFYNGQWLEFFRGGPNREPLYSFMIAASMLTGKCLGVSYTYPLKILCFGFLAAVMIINQQILKLLNTNRWVQASTILYTGFSPILINSALCLYSEIACFPWLVAVVLLSIHYLRSLSQAPFKCIGPAVGLGLCLLAFTFVKGIGEILSPLYLSWLLFYGWRQSGQKVFAFLRQSKIKILLVLLVFYVPLLSFKTLNYAFNGHFVFTTRSDRTLYGPLVQRSQRPLNMDNLLTHLLTAPVSYPLCSRFFPDDKCAIWYISPDTTFEEFEGKLSQLNLSLSQQEEIVRRDTFNALISHPIRQLVYLLQEGLKMFFWETSQGPFVVYPPWLDSLFNNPFIVILMSLGAGCFCLCGFFIASSSLKNEPLLITFVLTSLLVILFGFINIISRYAIIAAPLSILLNASCLSILTTPKPLNKAER